MVEYYIDQQFVPGNLPEPGKTPETPRPLREKALNRAIYYTQTFGSMVKGARPNLSSNQSVMVPGMDGNHFVRETCSIMSETGYLPEEAKAYYIEKEPDRKLGFNPVPAAYIEEKEKRLKSLKEVGVTYPRIAGDGNAHLALEEIDRQIASSNMTVAIPGNIAAARDWTHLVECKLKGRMLDHPLIIESPFMSNNDQGFWDSLLVGLKIADKHMNHEARDPYKKRGFVDFKALEEHFGIYVTRNRDQTTAFAKALAPLLKEPKEQFRSPPLVPDGATIFVATGTMKKFDELERIYKAKGVNVKIRSIFELVDTYKSAPEEKKTYEGNVEDKMQAAFNAWNNMPDETRIDRLKHLGIKRSQAFILAEDSGFDFHEPGLANEPEFHDISGKIISGAPFPGVETGPNVLGSHGIQGFMKKIDSIFHRRQLSGHAVNYGVTKKCVLALAPLDQPDRSEIANMRMVSSEVEGRISLDPKPDTGSIEIDNYLIPHNMPVAPGKLNKRTEAQLGDEFYTKYSPRAIAWSAMAKDVGIQMDPSRQAEDDYERDFHVGIVVDGKSYRAKAEAQKLANQSYQEGFGVTEYKTPVKRADSLETELLKQTDGVVFAFDPARAKEDFWRNTYLFTSMIVGEQTHDKVKFRKPFYLVNPKEGKHAGAFDYLEKMVEDFHHKGTVSEDPATLFKSVPDVGQAVERLKEDRKRYRRFHLPAYAHQETPNEPKGGLGSDKKFNVAIFCSATNENAKYKQDTARLVNGLIDADIGLVSGAGGKSSMGVITDIAFERRNEGAKHVGSNVPHIQLNEGDVEKKVHDQFLLARNIYERMEYMIDHADAFCIAAGGTGTVQEMALLAWLKKRAIEDPKDTYAKQKMEHKDIVIINSNVPSADGKRKGFYDELIHMIPKDDFKKLGIHVVDSPDAALKKLKELEKEKLSREGHVEVDDKPRRKRGQSSEGVGARH